MKWKDLSEAQIAWILWNLHQRFSDLLWRRYEIEFLDLAMDENQRKLMVRTLETELNDLEPLF
jgi:hypothetical protein